MALLHNQASACQHPLMADLFHWPVSDGPSGLLSWGYFGGSLPSSAVSGMGVRDAGQGEAPAFMSHCVPSSPALATALNCCWSLVPHWGEGGARRGSRL